MNATNPFLSPGYPRGYIPYFYESGLFQLYDSPADRPQTRPSSIAAGSQTPSAGVPDHFALDRNQTVEEIIAHGYLAVPHGDPVTAILADKQQTSWLGLDDVIGQVRKRHEIYERHLYQIELGKCAAMNSLYTAEAYHGPADSKQFYSRHKRLQELYEQQRDERTSLWKDVSRLRLLLPEVAQSYLGARRKIEALEETVGDLL